MPSKGNAMMTKEGILTACLVLVFYFLASCASYQLGKQVADGWWQAHQVECETATDPAFAHETLLQMNYPDPETTYTINFPQSQKGICGYEVRRDSLTQFTFKPIVKCEAQEPKDAK